MFVDYLLTKIQQDAYEEQLEINDNAMLDFDVQDELLSKYLGCENEIDYIYYTGLSGKDTDKYSLDEFMNEMKESIPNTPEWPIMVALSGAGVVWKNKDSVLDIDKIVS